MKKLTSSLAVMALIVSISACQKQETAITPANAPKEAASPAATTTTKKNQVTVETREMAIDVSKKTIPAGETEFLVKNVGKVPHEVVFFKTDLALDKLPTESNGKLKEDDKRLKKLKEVEPEELENGKVETVKLKLTPGRYVLICNVGGHFQAGMKTALTVQ